MAEMMPSSVNCMCVLFFLAFRANAEEIDLMIGQSVTGFLRDFLVDTIRLECGNIIDAATFRAAHMRMMARVRIVPESIFADIEFLGKSQIAKDGKSLVDCGQAHRGVEGLKLLVDGVGIWVRFGVGQHIIDGQTLRRYLEAG